MRRTTRRTCVGRLITLAAMGCAAVGACFPAAAAEKSCALRQYGSIDLIAGPDKRASNNMLVSRQYYVPVTIDGHSGLMRLALSSGISLLDEGAVTSLGLKMKMAAIEGVTGGKKLNRFAEMKSLMLGGVRFGKTGFLVITDAPLTEGPDGKPVFGSLGTDSLTVMDFELDLSRRKLNLFSHDHCEGRVVYWAKEWATEPFFIGPYRTLFFPLELEGHRIEATFAPHAGVSVLSTDVTKRVYGFDKDSPGVQSAPYEDETIAHFQAMQLTGRGMGFRNTPVRLVDAPAKERACKLELRSPESRAIGYASCENRYPMALGGNVLEKMRIYFATKEKMLYFTLADGTLGAPSSTPAESADPVEPK